MAQKGSQFRAEANPALRTVCAHCGKRIPTEVGHPHPLDAEDRGVWRETWASSASRTGVRKSSPPATSAIRLAGGDRVLCREPTQGDAGVLARGAFNALPRRPPMR